mmetsp:Transcript_21376/g.29963  ORF Transcript_21376/g.29963 Transcript_21376/m.29963 type:complete len:291 (+) Transcript_21376:97-969(+)
MRRKQTFPHEKLQHFNVITYFISITFIFFILIQFVHCVDLLEPEDSFPIWYNGGFTITIDVRSKEEYEEGHLPGAILVENMSFDSSTSSKFIRKFQGCQLCAIAVYCRTGARASLSSKLLEESGFKNVYNIYGVNQLFSQGYPKEVGKNGGFSIPECMKNSKVCITSPTPQPSQEPTSSPTSACPDKYWAYFNVPRWKNTERNCAWISKLMRKKRKKFCKASFSDAAQLCPNACAGLCKCTDSMWRRFKMPKGNITCFKLGQKNMVTILKFCNWNKFAKITCPHTCAGWC